MIPESVVQLASWQFALSALLHFIFIPLTLGLSILLVIMETAYVLTGKAIYKSVSQFWSQILIVNFGLGIATRLPVIFQFGMNGSYFAHYGGEIFGLPLAIEALSSFFLAAVLLGPYLYGWEHLSKGRHLVITILICLAVHGSACWILLANGWLQNPLGAEFNYLSLRLEISSFSQLLANPIATSKIVHTLASCNVTAMGSVLAISAWLLLRTPQDEIARYSFKLATALGAVAILVLSLGDTTPYQQQAVQIRKLAALNHLDNRTQLANIETHIRSGIKAYALLQELRDDKHDPLLTAAFNEVKADLGYALLLKRWTEHVADASEQQIRLAAEYSLPTHSQLLFWINRLMIASGVIILLWFASTFWQVFRQKSLPTWTLKMSLFLLPLPWLACVAGWFVTTAGIQPWAIAEILPTFLSISSLSVKDLLISLTLYTIIYGLLLLGGFFQMRGIIFKHLALPNPIIPS